jgi:hypothetical protein
MAIFRLFYQMCMINYYDCGEISGMNEWQGRPKYLNETWPSTALQHRSQHDLTRVRTRAAMMSRLAEWYLTECGNGARTSPNHTPTSPREFSVSYNATLWKKGHKR